MAAVLLHECATAPLAVSHVENVSLVTSQILTAQLEIAYVSKVTTAHHSPPPPTHTCTMNTMSCMHTCTHTHMYINTCSSGVDSLAAVITISFEQESYSVLEGSSQQLQVCAHTTDRIKSEQRLTVNIVTTDHEAVGATQGSHICVLSDDYTHFLILVSVNFDLASLY